MITNDQYHQVSGAFDAASASTRLKAALTAGTSADERFLDILVARSGVEPDFFVRDMMTWALCRLPSGPVRVRLVGELTSDNPRACAQALHTLSKIGDPQVFSNVAAMIHDRDDEVARTAWRAAVSLVDHGHDDDDARALAAQLGIELGRGDDQLQLSLSRALLALGEAAQQVVADAASHADEHVRAHAAATERLIRDPDSAFVLSVDAARRVSVGAQA